jgi:hypothetical protein
MAKRDPVDYDALSRAVESGNYSVRGPLDDKDFRALMDEKARAAEEAPDDDGAPLPPHVVVTRLNRPHSGSDT